jgi:Mn2+/Fe2+ NRAMP family transporter
VANQEQFWSESKIYLTVVWSMITIGTIIILTGLEPVVLLIIASSGGGFVIALYSTMLIVLNRRALPEEIKLKSWRLPIIAITALMFISLSLFLLYQIISDPRSLA